MLGFEVETRDSAKDRPSRATPTGARLNIVLPREGGARVSRESRSDFKALAHAPGEPSDHLALRTAELARALLLDDGEEPARTSSASVWSRRVSATLSQRLVLNDYGSAAGGIGQDVIFWLGRFGLGAVGTYSLSRQSWRADPKKFSLRFATLGLLLKYSFAETSDEIFEAQVLGSMTSAALMLREEGGKDEDRFRGTAWGVAAGGGIDLSVRAAPNLRFGGQALTEVITLLSWPEAEDGELGGKEADLLVDESELRIPRLQLTLSLAATGHW